MLCQYPVGHLEEMNNGGDKMGTVEMREMIVDGIHVTASSRLLSSRLVLSGDIQ